MSNIRIIKIFKCLYKGFMWNIGRIRESCYPKVDPFWESRFDELARFHSEVDHGLMHTPEYIARMKSVQFDYRKKVKAQAESQKILTIGWVSPSRPE